MRRIKKGLAILLGISIGWIGISNAMSLYERSQNKAPGQMVEIEGSKMHVYIKGKGKQTIVLMSGLGTAAPVLDFEPLTEELSKKYKVVIAEPFGYGWSEQTNRKRFACNMVEELREALNKVGIREKVILMPHSVSGLYAMYYANKYPDEVEAIVGIDCTLPKMCDYFNEKMPKVPTFIQYLAPLGVLRLDAMLRPQDVYPTSGIENYSKANLELTKKITAWQGYNKDVIMEGEAASANMEATFDMKFAEDLPVLIFARADDRITEDGKTTESFYKMYLDGLKHGELITLEGKHYLHHTCAKEIAEDTSKFLEKN